MSKTKAKTSKPKKQNKETIVLGVRVVPRLREDLIDLTRGVRDCGEDVTLSQVVTAILENACLKGAKWTSEILMFR